MVACGEDMLADQTVVVFAMPAAGTPICSSVPLPSCDELAPMFFVNGVDSVRCATGNDVFVMNDWARTLAGSNIEKRRDGDADCTAHIGGPIDKCERGRGQGS